MNVDGDESQRIPGVDGQVEQVAAVGEHPEWQRKLGIEAREEGPIGQLERVLDLLHDDFAQLEFPDELAGALGEVDAFREVHLHQTAGYSLSAGHDVVAGAVFVVGPKVVLEVDQGEAVRGQPGGVHVKIVSGEQEEVVIVSFAGEVDGEDLAVAVRAVRAGHGEGVVVPGHSHKTCAVRLPGQLSNRVVARNVVDRAKVEVGNLQKWKTG